MPCIMPKEADSLHPSTPCIDTPILARTNAVARIMHETPTNPLQLTRDPLGSCARDRYLPNQQISLDTYILLVHKNAYNNAHELARIMHETP